MGLESCFEAEDLATYRVFAEADGWLPGGVKYNPDLVTPPRIYREELFPGFRPALWGGHDPNRWGPSTVNLFAVLRQVHWPSWGAARWRFDGQHGRLLDRLSGGSGFGALAVTFDAFTVEPSGAVWWFGVHANAYEGGAVLMDPTTMEATETAILSSSFAGGAGIGIADFAVDRASDRVWVRWLTDNVGQVNAYRLSTREKLHELWTPNATAGIVLTHDGFVYVADALGWLCVYDYDGRPHGAMRQPPPSLEEAPGGVVYGWDAYYKRLLRLKLTAVEADGASTLRIDGLFPVAEAALLTPPVPRLALRKGRRTHLLARVCGEGGEPIIGRAAVLGGGITGAGASDHHGDVAIPVTPAAAGELEAEVTVE